MKQISWCILIVTLLFSCKDDQQLPNATINQLKVDDAIMPVHIHGNKSSDVAIIVVHGGPGESAILKRAAIGFYRLEEDHIVAYYDQRGSGISSGDVDPESLTIEQMAQDLEAVVELVDEITTATKFFIVSLDWGGAIAATYLSSTAINPQIKGYIASTPGFHAAKQIFTSRDSLQVIAAAITAADPTIENTLQTFLNANGTIDVNNYETYYRLIEGIRGIVFNTQFENSAATLPAFINRSLEQNEVFVLNDLSFEGDHFLNTLNVEPLLPQIPVPTKIIWGERDLLFPIQQAREFANLLGGASDAEIISRFRFSAHRPYFEEGDRFYATIATWITLFD